MKLIFCPDCSDVFKLAHETRTCACGKCRAKYINHSKAVTNGKGVCLAISNPSLVEACFTLSPKARVECWVRPHTGENNPNTSIDRDL